MRQQGSRVRAGPPPTVRRSRTRRRIRHQRLVPQQVLVQVPEAAAAHASTRRRSVRRLRSRSRELRVWCCVWTTGGEGVHVGQAEVTGAIAAERLDVLRLDDPEGRPDGTARRHGR